MTATSGTDVTGVTPEAAVTVEPIEGVTNAKSRDVTCRAWPIEGEGWAGDVTCRAWPIEGECWAGGVTVTSAPDVTGMTPGVTDVTDASSVWGVVERRLELCR